MSLLKHLHTPSVKIMKVRFHRPCRYPGCREAASLEVYDDVSAFYMDEIDLDMKDNSKTIKKLGNFCHKHTIQALFENGKFGEDIHLCCPKCKSVLGVFL